MNHVDLEESLRARGRGWPSGFKNHAAAPTKAGGRAISKLTAGARSAARAILALTGAVFMNVGLASSGVGRRATQPAPVPTLLPPDITVVLLRLFRRYPFGLPELFRQRRSSALESAGHDVERAQLGSAESTPADHCLRACTPAPRGGAPQSPQPSPHGGRSGRPGRRIAPVLLDDVTVEFVERGKRQRALGKLGFDRAVLKHRIDHVLDDTRLEDCGSRRHDWFATDRFGLDLADRFFKRQPLASDFRFCQWRLEAVQFAKQCGASTLIDLNPALARVLRQVRDQTGNN